jgi:hypothetical protein
VRFFAPQLPRDSNGILPYADVMIGAPDDYIVRELFETGTPAISTKKIPA